MREKQSNLGTLGTASLTVVMPVRNHGRRIGEDLEAVHRHLAAGAPRDWEILVVDDASQDGTCSEVIDFARTHHGVLLLRNPAGLGSGYAARQGILFARGERILLLADRSPAPLAALTRMESHLEEGHDLVVASHRIDRTRPLPPIRLAGELLRHFLGVVRRAGTARQTPTPAYPIHLYRRDAALELYRRQRIMGGSFGLEVLYLAQRFRFGVLELGLPAGPDPDDPFTGRFPAGVGGLGDLLRIRIHRLRGDYG